MIEKCQHRVHMQNNNNKNEKIKKSCTLPPSLQWAGVRIPANMYKGRLIGKPPASLLMAGRQATGPHYSIKTNIFWKSKKNKKRPLNRHLISPLLLYKAQCSLQNARGTAWPIKKNKPKNTPVWKSRVVFKIQRLPPPATH